MLFYLPLEAPNGALTVFTMPVDYVAGTLNPWINGIKEHAASGTFSELPPNKVQLNYAPPAGEVLEFTFRTS